MGSLLSTIIWHINISLILFFLFASKIPSGEETWWISMYLFVNACFIYHYLDYYFRVFKKPIQSARVKVISLFANKMSYYITILLDNKSVILTISKKQYKALKKNDIVDLVYQGWLVHSVKRTTDKTPIINEQYFPKEAKAAKEPKSK